jgi:hypothetical protein
VGVKLSDECLRGVNHCNSRLISERNLRYNLESTKVAKSDTENVRELSDLIETANQNQVESEYITKAQKFQQQMSDNIKAREILRMLMDYPEREYPEVEEVDPKKKKSSKKEEEKKKKKRKKKEPPFPTPEWALELEAVQSKVQKIQELATNAEDIFLEQEHVDKINDQLARFKKEIKFRQYLLE